MEAAGIPEKPLPGRHLFSELAPNPYLLSTSYQPALRGIHFASLQVVVGASQLTLEAESIQAVGDLSGA